MKIPFVALLAFSLFAVNVPSLHAQASVAPAPAQGPLSFLTPAQQQQYATARVKALEADPQLKTEGIVLAGQQEHMMQDANVADRQAYMEQMREHRQKLRAAMLKVDPALQPVFDAIDKRISELRSQQLGPVQSSTSPGTNPAGR